MVIGVLSAALAEEGPGDGWDDPPAAEDVSGGEGGGAVAEAGSFDGVLHPARGNASAMIAAKVGFFRRMGDGSPSNQETFVHSSKAVGKAGWEPLLLRVLGGTP